MDQNPRSYSTISIEEGHNNNNHNNNNNRRPPSLTTKLKLLLPVSFIGTILCAVTYIPTLLWVSSLLRRFIRDQYDCQGLVNLPTNQPAFALILIFMLIPLYPLVVKECEAVAILILLFVVAVFGVLGSMQVMESRTFFGLFGPPPPFMPTGNNTTTTNNNNHTEYWKVNMKSCECKTRSCEDDVYQAYLVDKYWNNQLGYTLSLYWNNHTAYTLLLQKKSVGSCKPAAYCDQLLEDKSNADLIYEKGMLCYSAYSSKNGENGQCNGCYACEEEFIKKFQKEGCWKMGNILYVMSWLLILSFFIVFADELGTFFRG